MTSKHIRLLWLILTGLVISATLISSDPITRSSTKRFLSPRYDEYDGDFLQSMNGLAKGPFYFSQWIDHDDLPRQTFKQRYWVNDAYYVQSGPRFLLISDIADDHQIMFSSISMFNEMAKQNGGMMVILELRYHGESFPVDNLSEDNLKYLTTRQLLGDIAYFAKTGMNRPLLRASMVPWVLIGGSFPGELVNWARLMYPSIFWAGYSSSGMVQAKMNFWQFFDDTARKMPLDCARDIQKVVKYFDSHAFSHDEGELTELKEVLGLPQIEHIDDVAGIMAFDVAHWSQVDYMVRPKKYTRFDKLCDALGADKKGERVPPSRRDTHHLVNAWRRWNLREYQHDVDDSWTTHNPNVAIYQDLNRDNRRVWKWLQCTEYGWFFTAPSPDKDPVVSQLITLERELRVCSLYFPKRYRNLTASPAINATNGVYGGWDRRAKKVVFTIGGKDPYLGVTFKAMEVDSSVLLDAPVFYTENGHHMSDFVDPVGREMYNVQDGVQGLITEWLDEWQKLQ